MQFSSNKIVLVLKATLAFTGLSWCAESHSASLATSPLFLGDSVKPNVLLAIDDSGSMDSEIMLNTTEGIMWYNKASNSVVDNNGELYQIGEAAYYYLFPNGYSETYNSQRVYDDDTPAVPPIKPYAFVRSPAWNNAYYDPMVDYAPWPSYEGTTYKFGDVDPLKAPWDPVYYADTFYVDLTSNLYVDYDYWRFFLSDDDMICDDAGNSCPLGVKAYDYFPATYYYPDKSGSYIYNQPITTSKYVDPSKYLVIEAEEGELEFGVDVQHSEPDASQEAYVNSEENNLNNIPTQASMIYDFEATGTVHIWIRRIFPNGSSDSFWMNLRGYKYNEIATEDVNSWYLGADGEHWYQWRDGHTNSPTWEWEKWGTVTLDGNSHTLHMKARETDAKLDQILITSDASFVPTTQQLTNETLVAGPVKRSCATDTDVRYYKEFIRNPSRFTGVDALAPDGTCLKQYEIKPATASYPSGKTYTEELQNFANWFTYYRRRHHAMRGGLAGAFQGLSGIRAGMYWFNDRRTIPMYDMDTEQQKFLDDHYPHVGRYATPLREALNHAGEELKRTSGTTIITEACQKNFTLLFTDGFASDIADFTSVGNVDTGSGKPYEDSYSNTAADVAMKYYDENLRPDLATGQVSVDEQCSETSPSPLIDCNKDLHMVTFSIGLGAKGSIFGETHFDVEDAHDNPPTWPNVNLNRDGTQVDDIYHAAVNGRGEMFYAKTPQKLRSTLSDALRSIVSRIGSASGVTFNTSTLSTNSVVFTARFNSAAWSGELKTIRLDGTTGEIGGTAWEASEILDRASPNDRVIITNDGSDGVPFRWSNLTADMKSDLNTAPDGSTDALGEARLNFLRGDTSKEGAEFRARASVLGDIVHSSPLFVGAPEQAWTDVPPFGDGTVANHYSTYKQAQKGRQEMVYIGANDGMLHGFNADASIANGGGTELFAYVPSMVYNNTPKNGLHYLTDPDYTHRYYVDLSPIAADVFIKSTPTATRAWRTILIGGLRNGGKGLFAIDVTDPKRFSETNASDLVLWEFTPDDDADLGDITTKPVIAMMNNGKWAVIFGNGYNSSSARLFILFIEEGVDGTWSAGDYVEIDTGVAGGLSQPAVADLNGDKVADRIYAGDVQGNMWAFDVSNKATTKWVIAKKSGSKYYPMFTAKDKSGVNQPITSAPILALNPDSPATAGTAPNVLVYFGTGSYLYDGDPSDKQTQTFYGVWDMTKSVNLQRSNLEPLTIATTDGLRRITGNTVDYSSKYGFYTDLPSSGERVVISPRVRGGIIFFNTTIPESDPCSFGGSGWLMTVDLANGKTPSEPVFDTNGDGTVDEDDSAEAGQLVDTGIPSESGFLGDNQYTPTSAGTLERRAIKTGEAQRTGRLAWDEIVSKDE